MTYAKATCEFIGMAMSAAVTAQSMGTFTVPALAEKVGVARNTAYRYKYEMMRHGWVIRDGKDGGQSRYRWIA